MLFFRGQNLVLRLRVMYDCKKLVKMKKGCYLEQPLYYIQLMKINLIFHIAFNINHFRPIRS